MATSAARDFWLRNHACRLASRPQFLRCLYRLDELARWGVERFSVEAMAERHHLEVAMIYRHWGDRQPLIVGAAGGVAAGD